MKANVDKAIIESHDEYVADTNFLSTVGASHASQLDDSKEVVPRVGTWRASMNQSWGAERTARTSQSETPEQVAERINAFVEVGVRHIVMDFVGPYEEKEEQIQRFADEVRPLLNAP